MLDADTFAAFEAGDAFDPGVAGRLRELVHLAGNLGEPAEAYLASRGRLPSLDPLPRQRGLGPSAGEACGPPALAAVSFGSTHAGHVSGTRIRVPTGLLCTFRCTGRGRSRT
jgi:hypothetical protein